MEYKSRWKSKDREWSGDVYGKNRTDQMHALGVVAANFNGLEFSFLCIFSHYFDFSDRSGVLFQNFKNNFRVDTLRAIIESYEKQPLASMHVEHFLLGFEICADNRNLLMHSEIELAPESSELRMSKGTKSDPFTRMFAQFDLPTLRKVADDIMNFEEYGHEITIYLDESLRKQMKAEKTHVHIASLQKPPLPDRLSLQNPAV
jgi:hypothetical protein